MHFLPDPSRRSPTGRTAVLGLVFVAAAVSCARDFAGPGSGERYARGLSWDPVFPPALQLSSGITSGLALFDRVHVLLHHEDSTVALDTTIGFPSGADSLTIRLTVKLLKSAPVTGEPMTLDLAYLNAAGATVFTGGPVSVIAEPPLSTAANSPVKIAVTYIGVGANAASVVISPRSDTVSTGLGFTFSAVALDANGAPIAGTPVVWTSLDPTIAAITSPAEGAGVALSLQGGAARIVAQLLTGPADTVIVNVLAGLAGAPSTLRVSPEIGRSASDVGRQSERIASGYQSFKN